MKIAMVYCFVSACLHYGCRWEVWIVLLYLSFSLRLSSSWMARASSKYWILSNLVVYFLRFENPSKTSDWFNGHSGYMQSLFGLEKTMNLVLVILAGQ